MADQLASILQLWQRGSLILDEVDLLLHPLRSELNFPVGQKEPLDLAPDRWDCAIHLLDAIFYSSTPKLHEVAQMQHSPSRCPPSHLSSGL